MKKLSYFLSCLKVGTIGFGGGSALIPVVEQEMIQNKKLLDEDEYITHTVVANITPGALPVKLGNTIGYEHGGVAGALLGAYGMAIPGSLLTVLLVAMISLLNDTARSIFDYAVVGISAFIVFLLAAYIVKTVAQGNKKVNISIMILAFLLTGGGEIRKIVSWLAGGDPQGALLSFTSSKPLFDISVLTLILMAFYVILYIQRVKSPAGIAGGFVLAIGYCFFKGKLAAELGLGAYANYYMLAIIIILVLVYLALRPKEKSKSKVKLSIPKGIWISIAILMGIPIVLTAVCLVMQVPRILPFAGNVVISTVTSFGGGEAYMAVAQDFFVGDTLYISQEAFTSQVISVANMLPGPILVKVATGIGYVYGVSCGGQFIGIMVALVAFMASVGACCSVCLIVLALYESLKESALIMGLKKHILPVICGMLISTALSMLADCMEVCVEECSFIPWLSFIVLLLGVAAMYAFHKKFHKVPDILILVGAAVISLGVFLILV